MNSKCMIAAALGASLTLIFTGCAKDSSESTDTAAEFTPRLDTSEETTINIIGCMANFEALEAVITDFEEYYPNCDVLYIPFNDSNEYWSNLEARLKSDSSVGLFMMSSRYYTSDSMKELCLDLSEQDIDLSAIQSEVITSSTVDDKLYEVPLAHNAMGLIVNKTILEEQGIEIPSNLSEFLAACEKLKNAGYVPIQGYSATLDYYLTYAMSYVLMNNEFKSASDTDLESLKAGEEGSAQVLFPVFEVLNTLYESGYIDKDVNSAYTDVYNDAILKFFEGDVPFLVGSTETLSGMKKRESKSEHFTAEPFEYAFMSAPLGEDGAYVYLENWYGFSINSNCENTEWAVEFMRFLMTEDEINQLASVKGLPSVANESDDDRFIGLNAANENYYCTSSTFFPQSVCDVFYEVEAEFAEGTISLDDVTSEIERRLREGDY